MFGDNYDIPAFRWYDKDQQKLYVSGADAAELNARYAKGNGLMRGGSSINNMLNGDAEKSMLTMADLFEAGDEEKKRRAEDIYLLMLNPYFLTRTIVFFLVDVVRELWEGWQQKRQDVQPRLNRLAHGYPFVRAATTVLMRDICGQPRHPGHHARRALDLRHLARLRRGGAPFRPLDQRRLRRWPRYDQVIARVRRVIKEKAPRPYDLIILSDHGQSFGPPSSSATAVSSRSSSSSSCRRASPWPQSWAATRASPR